MSILEKNLSCIKKYNPQLADTILNCNCVNAEFELIESKSGATNLCRNSQPVHSPVDPESEAIDLLHSIPKEMLSIVVIYGLGLGYVLDRFNKSFPGKIIVFEPDIETLRITLEIVDLSEILSSENVMISNDFESLENAYKNLFYVNYECQATMLDYHKVHDTENVNAFVEKLTDIVGIYQSNYKNLKKKARYWTVSAFMSAYYAAAYNPINELKDSFKGKTAVVISAGPSLNKNIQEVKKNRDKVVVFCVGTALKTVVESGITPDFVVQIEFVNNAYNQIKDIDLSDINLIVVPTSNHNIHTKISAKNIFCYYPYNDNTSKWLEMLWGIPGAELKNAGSVSLNAFFAAMYMGFSQIVLIGQDLAYTGGDCYAKGSSYDHIKCDINKDNPHESSVSSAVAERVHIQEMNSSGKKVLPIKGQVEDIVYAPADYILCLKYYEDIARNLPESVKVINATEGGAYINGFEHRKLVDALEEIEECRYPNFDILNKVYKQTEKIVSRRRKAFYPEYKNVLSIAKRLRPEVQKYMKMYVSQSSEKVSLEQKLNAIEEISVFYKKYLNTVQMNYHFANVIYVENMGVVDAFKRFDKNNESSVDYLYTNLCEYIKGLSGFDAEIELYKERITNLFNR